MKLNSNIPALVAVLISAHATADTKIEIIRDLVDSYQTESYERYGVGIELRFFGGDTFQATGGMVATGKPEITFYGGILQRLDSEELVVVACHELGHILGRVPLKISTDASDTPQIQLDSVEGEADYFAGSCAARYFRDGDRAREAARTLFSGFARTRIEHWDSRFFDAFDGIDSRYPDNQCRLLSVTEGALGGKRPRCWFNPNSANFTQAEQ